VAEESHQVQIAEALIELRGSLECLGIKTRSSVGNNEFFYAFLNTDNNGVPSDGVFVSVRGDEFSWSRDGKHSMSDIPGAARKIARIVQESAAPWSG
jgi:hypothetical protein